MQAYKQRKERKMAKYILVSTNRKIHSGSNPCGHCRKAKKENKIVFDSYEEAETHLGKEKPATPCHFCLQEYEK